MRKLSSDKVAYIKNLISLQEARPNKDVERLEIYNVKNLEGGCSSGYVFKNLNELKLDYIQRVFLDAFESYHVDGSTDDITLYLGEIGYMYLSDLKKFKKVVQYCYSRIICLKANKEKDIDYINENIDFLHNIVNFIYFIDTSELVEIENNNGCKVLRNIPANEIFKTALYIEEKVNRLFNEDEEVFIHNLVSELPRCSVGKHKDLLISNHNGLCYFHLMYKPDPYSITLYKNKNITKEAINYLASTKIIRLIDNTYHRMTEHEFIEALKERNPDIIIENKFIQDQQNNYNNWLNLKK